MNEQGTVNVGSASHQGEAQVLRDSHFIYEYSRRRVPLPVISYMAIADASGEQQVGQNAAKRSLDILRDAVEPAVIAEEELAMPQMEKILREGLSRVNEGLLDKSRPEGAPTPDVSLTAVIADAHRAYIGHVGTGRVYLLHSERLYDLTPVGELSAAPPAGETLQLFAEGASTETAAPEQVVGGRALLLGQAAEVRAGYNEVEIAPGDVLLVCTDGLWKAVSEEELVENLLSAMNVQRSASQLVRLAFTRDATDNATMVAWQYVIPGQGEVADVRQERKHERRERTADVFLIALLSVVLLGIFAVGFAFGWRISDAIRRPAKEKAKQSASSTKKEEASEQTGSEPTISAPASSAPASSAPASSAPVTTIIKVATVNGQGVRMRSSPDVNASLVGLLKNGEQVSVLATVTGADSNAWSRVKGTATLDNKSFDAEGFVRNDYLVIKQ